MCLRDQEGWQQVNKHKEFVLIGRKMKTKNVSSSRMGRREIAAAAAEEEQ